jgi:hypothetical protein
MAYEWRQESVGTAIVRCRLCKKLYSGEEDRRECGGLKLTSYERFWHGGIVHAR